MVRRTKEDAMATRQKLLDAAEHLFQEQGVSRTSLHDIARRAGATRGAIYWHFKDKADLFNAMMDRVSLPMEERVHRTAEGHANPEVEQDPLLNIWRATTDCLTQIVNDAQTRRVLEVATQKVEYVDELRAVRQRHIAVRSAFLGRFEKSIDAAAKRQGLSLGVPVAVAARGFHALVDGLMQNWLLDPQAFNLLTIGQLVMSIYLSGLGFDVKSLPQTEGADAGTVGSKQLLS